MTKESGLRKMRSSRLAGDAAAVLTNRKRRSRPVRIGVLSGVFPLLINFWPALLIFSQKAFIPIGLLFAGYGTAAYRRQMLVVCGMGITGLVILALQVPNEYYFSHYIGYLIFLISVPILNLAVREGGEKLLYYLAIFSAVNALLAIIFFLFSIDLSAYRGLNRILGDDGVAHRVYFESTSLVAVFSVSAFRRRWVKIVLTLLVLGYAVFLAKSVFVIALFLVNRLAPIVARGGFVHQVLALATVVVIALVGPMVVTLLRPDVALSIGVKLLQLEVILDSSSSLLFGSGWGFVIDEIANNEEQPYQIEMQLAMLLIQIGFFGTAIFAFGMLFLIRGTADSRGVALMRWFVYLLIGINNPWLFIPSWYLTTALLFRDVKAS